MKKRAWIAAILVCLLMTSSALAGADILMEERERLVERAKNWLGLDIPGDAEFTYFFPESGDTGDYVCRYMDEETGQQIQIQVIHAQAPNQPRYEISVQRMAQDGAALPVSDAVKLSLTEKQNRFNACMPTNAADFLDADRILYGSSAMPDGGLGSQTDRDEAEWLWSVMMIFGGDGTQEYDKSMIKLYWDPVTDSLCRLLIFPLS